MLFDAAVCIQDQKKGLHGQDLQGCIEVKGDPKARMLSAPERQLVTPSLTCISKTTCTQRGAWCLALLGCAPSVCPKEGCAVR